MTIFLNGMCYAGKSTIGKLLGLKLQKQCLDSKDLFHLKYGLSESEYLHQFGKNQFKIAEEQSLLQNFGDIIVSLGGSAIYYDNIMNILKDQFIIIWLDVPFHVIQKRKNSETLQRPIIYPDGINTFEDLYTERYQKYMKYHTIRIKVSESDTINDVVDQILKHLKQ